METRYKSKKRGDKSASETTKEEARLGLTRGRPVTFNNKVESLATSVCQFSCSESPYPLSKGKEFRQGTFIESIPCSIRKKGQEGPDNLLLIFAGIPVGQTDDSESFFFCLSREQARIALAPKR